MAVTAFIYGNALVQALSGALDFDNGDVRVALLSAAYTPDQDADTFYDDVNANEVAGTGYTAGGEAVANTAITYDAATNTVTLDGDDIVWPASSITARYAVVYVNSGTAGTSPLVGLVDFGEDKTSDNGDFGINWNAAGMYTFTVD